MFLTYNVRKVFDDNCAALKLVKRGDNWFWESSGYDEHTGRHSDDSFPVNRTLTNPANRAKAKATMPPAEFQAALEDCYQTLISEDEAEFDEIQQAHHEYQDRMQAELAEIRKQGRVEAHVTWKVNL
jgi:hypothetical protein